MTWWFEHLDRQVCYFYQVLAALAILPPRKQKHQHKKWWNYEIVQHQTKNVWFSALISMKTVLTCANKQFVLHFHITIPGGRKIYRWHFSTPVPASDPARPDVENWWKTIVGREFSANFHRKHNTVTFGGSTAGGNVNCQRGIFTLCGKLWPSRGKGLRCCSRQTEPGDLKVAGRARPSFREFPLLLCITQLVAAVQGFSVPAQKKTGCHRL